MAWMVSTAVRSTRIRSLLAASALVLAACGGGGSSSPSAPAPPPVVTPPPPPPPTLATEIETKAEGARLLAEMGFGGSEADIERVVGVDAAEVLAEQFGMRRNAYLPRVRSLVASYGDNGRKNRAHTSIYWRDAVEADDQLRQRMVFALSQILVVSDLPMGNQPERMAHYMDVLGAHAFGNYRDLLEDITYTPAMGQYLTYRGNRKGDARTGRTPDENYARELLQLFSIGLVELNMDGTPRLGADGQPVETYDNEDVIGLARVFTGLDLRRDGDDRAADANYTPMAIFENRHSPLEKSFLGTTIPASTATAASIDQALDAIFEHPNVAPFVSRQLIQRFTASNPDPAYVRRVAEVFESGVFTAPNGRRFGAGERGDLEATLAAILLDESQHRDTATIRNDTDLGKVREPVLNFVHWARAFDVSDVTPENEWTLLYNASNRADWIGQMPFHSKSVFNFYRPGYTPVGTEAGDRGLHVPEFQILLAGNRAGYINMMTEYVFDSTYGPDGDTPSFTPDYSDEIALSDTPGELADHLDELLLGGRMEAATRATIVEVLDGIPVRTDNADNTAYDRFARTGAAIVVAVTSPEYMVR